MRGNSAVSIPTNNVAEVISVSDERDMVSMGSPYLYLEKPDVDWGRAREDAAAYCRECKGMSQVEPIGTTRRECLSWVGGDCTRFAIVGDYRCVE
jgi:hypothetical protein